MAKLKVIDGNVVDENGIKQVLQLGDNEQIEAIRKYEKKLTALNNEGIEVWPDFEVEVKATLAFECICGSNVYFETTANVEIDHENNYDVLDNKKIVCKSCNKHYKISVSDDDGAALVKFIK